MSTRSFRWLGNEPQKKWGTSAAKNCDITIVRNGKTNEKIYGRAETSSDVTSGPAIATSTTSLLSFFDGNFAR